MTCHKTSLGNVLQVETGADHGYEMPSVGMDDDRTWGCHLVALSGLFLP